MAETRADRVYRQCEKSIMRLITGDAAAVRGELANLRRGAGKTPGDDPYVWGSLLSDLPEDMLGTYGEPSNEEWAIYTALTLFALHQQGNDPGQHCVNKKGISLGSAAANLVYKDGSEGARERVARRFNQIALASDMPTMAYYLRSFIQLLRSNDIDLDYPLLSKDMYIYCGGRAASVRLSWGQDFYRSFKDDGSTEETKDLTNGKEG